MSDLDLDPDRDLVPLGTGARWRIWRDCELRSAGFPVTAIDGLCTDRAAATTAAIQAIAADPFFRAAITWQNPGVVTECLDRLLAGRPARGAVQRRRELKVASYLQRYALKNDTIGFFGPVGWARWDGNSSAIDMRPGPGLIAARSIHFEQWAVDAVATALARDPAIRMWLHPRRSMAHGYRDGVVHRTSGGAVVLTDEEVAVFDRCDGHHRLRELPAHVVDALEQTGLVSVGFDLPMGEHPELGLLGQIEQIPDESVRGPASRAVRDLIAARDEVAHTVDDPVKLLAAMKRLDEVFERVSQDGPNRRAGQTYAGRRVIYEDTLRDVQVRLGKPLLDTLATPLALLLDSARWFVGQVAQSYTKRFLELYERQRARLGADRVPLAALLAAATPDLAFSFRDLPGPVAQAVPELQRRWAEALNIPAGVRRHAVPCAALAETVGRLFPPSPLPWSSAVHHSPDIMIAARDADAVNRDEFLLILGELHMSVNTLDSRVELRLHPRPEALLRRDVADRTRRRMLPVPAKSSPEVNSRTYPPGMLVAEDFYWTMHTDNVGAPGTVHAGADMTVVRDSDRLWVDVGDDGLRLDLLDVLGEYLATAVMNGFKPLPVHGHRPRVSIDQLVIAREAWTFAPSAMRWAFVADPEERHRAARQWQRENGVSPRAFFRVAVEDKPMFVDFTSAVLVQLLTSAVRRAADEEPDSQVSFTELLPDLDEHWLRDAAGQPYTSELRIVAVDTDQPDPTVPGGNQ